MDHVHGGRRVDDRRATVRARHTSQLSKAARPTAKGGISSKIPWVNRNQSSAPAPRLRPLPRHRSQPGTSSSFSSIRVPTIRPPSGSASGPRRPLGSVSEVVETTMSAFAKHSKPSGELVGAREDAVEKRCPVLVAVTSVTCSASRSPPRGDTRLVPEQQDTCPDRPPARDGVALPRRVVALPRLRNREEGDHAIISFHQSARFRRYQASRRGSARTRAASAASISPDPSANAATSARVGSPSRRGTTRRPGRGSLVSAGRSARRGSRLARRA